MTPSINELKRHSISNLEIWTSEATELLNPVNFLYRRKTFCVLWGEDCFEAMVGLTSPSNLPGNGRLYLVTEKRDGAKSSIYYAAREIEGCSINSKVNLQHIFPTEDGGTFCVTYRPVTSMWWGKEVLVADRTIANAYKLAIFQHQAVAWNPVIRKLYTDPNESVFASLRLKEVEFGDWKDPNNLTPAAVTAAVREARYMRETHGWTYSSAVRKFMKDVGHVQIVPEAKPRERVKLL